MNDSAGWPTFQLSRISWAPIPSRAGPADAPIDPLESARVQTLRGVACLLLVAFHAVGSTAASGLHAGDDSPYRVFTNLFVHVRMPLFTFLSGLVYAGRPLRAGREWQFARLKLRRLGVPLMVTATVLYLLHRAMHDEVPPLRQVWTIFVFPYWHLWFVQALLLVFMVLVVLESLGALATATRFAAVLACSVGLYFLGQFEGRDLAGMHNATYLLPFFLWGLGAHRYRQLLRSRRALLVTVLCFVGAQGFHSYLVLTRAPAPLDPVAHRSLLNLVIGMSASLAALQLLPRARVMERVGGCSYPIYLYHPVFVAAVLTVAGGRIAQPTSVLFATAVAAGVAGPMLMGALVRQLPGGPLLLEGRSAPSAEAKALGGRAVTGSLDPARPPAPAPSRARLFSWLGSDPG
jgi:peptidoglycan/LPS O-acetylase OafA/YrhL